MAPNPPSFVTNRPRRVLIAIVLAFLSLIVATSVFVGCERIDAGNVGIKVNLLGSGRGVQDVYEVSGFVWYNAQTQSVYEFPTYVQHVEWTGTSVEDKEGNEVSQALPRFVANTRDGAQFEIGATLNYRIDSGRIVSVFKKYRRDLKTLEQSVIKTSLFDAYRRAANTYTSDALMANTRNFEDTVRSIFVRQMGSAGFLVEDLTTSIHPPEALKAAIEEKNRAAQNVYQAENRARQAYADAQAKIAKARGDSAERVINALGEARANEVKQRTLSAQLLRQQWIERWDGKLPTIMSGSQNSLLLQIPPEGTEGEKRK